MTTGNRTWRHWSGGLVWLGLAVGSGTRSTAMAQQVAPVDQRVRHASTVTGAAPRRATIKAPLVFTGATVIDVRDGRHVPDQTVIIVGNRMRAVGSANTV